MSVVDSQETPEPPSHYYERAVHGDETWLEDAIEDYLGLYVTEAQSKICRALVNNENLLIVTANGLGKSYILAAITNVWLSCLYPAVVFATSGTEKKMKRTYCRPVKSLHENARISLPGTYKHSPERIDFEDDPEQFFEASAPKDAGELEGTHAAYTLAVIEEADKDEVDGDVMEAMDSLVTDERDRIIAIANPPDDEVNIVYELMSNPEWETIQFSSFESHNVQAELGQLDSSKKIDGLATLFKIKKDWRQYNGSEWPGVEVAKDSVDEIGLDERWYKRRLGVIPPDTATVHRPLTVQDVENAFERDTNTVTHTPQALALDVARSSGDFNSLAAIFGDKFEILDYWRGLDHVENENHVRDMFEKSWQCPLAIDAIGEGSGLADRIRTWYPNVIRFKSGSHAQEVTEYKNAWSEGMDMLGTSLHENLSYTSNRLREEMLAAARSVTFDEVYVNKYDDEVFKLDPKDDIKERLDRSPDLLDSAYMAVWVKEDEMGTSGNTIGATW